MADMKTVTVAPQAALGEATALAEHYRNRNLLLANAVHELTAQVKAQEAEIERLKKMLPPEAEAVETPPKKPAPKSPATVQ